MMPLEGRVLEGLDEFMLRLGHLRFLCFVLSPDRLSRTRAAREFAEALQVPVVPSPQDEHAIATYLCAKKLCACEIQSQGASQESDDAESVSQYRYSDLVVRQGADGSSYLLSSKTGSSPTVWSQDFWLAASEVRSRVGAVTADAKAGSKTGISHIIDWAEMLELLSGSGELSPEGRLLASLPGPVQMNAKLSNPYVLGPERVIFGSLLFKSDFDVLSRLMVRLAEPGKTFTKADITAIFIDAMATLGDDAEQSTALSSGKRFRITATLRDLGLLKEPREKHVRLATAWHRVSSRVESFVDLGYLVKGSGSEVDKYRYVYSATDQLYSAVASILSSLTATDWILDHLVDSLGFGRISVNPLTVEESISMIRHVACTLARPTRSYPIDVLTIGIAYECTKHGRPISLRAARTSITNLAHSRPDVARLSRGSTTDDPGYLSLIQG